jgi:hypothetical protein
MNRPTVHNPSTRRLQPVALITDRAKRYRAEKANEQRERRCYLCGRPGGELHNEHINGREADATAENLGYACRSCNTTKGAHFARIGFGKRTQQYNPTKAGAAANLAEWMEAVGVIRPHKGARYAGRNYGAGASGMKTAAAVAMIRATPPAKRSEFAAMVWGKRASRSRADRDEIPF